MRINPHTHIYVHIRNLILQLFRNDKIHVRAATLGSSRTTILIFDVQLKPIRLFDYLLGHLLEISIEFNFIKVN